MVGCACGKEFEDDFGFCPHCRKQKATQIVCPSCSKESAVGFSFCPHCGQALVTAPPVAETPISPPEVKAIELQQADRQEPTESSGTDRSNKVGTYVFGAFAVLALAVSIIHGIVPIYLLEAAAWAGAAWYWHKKKTHSELAKAIVIVFAALIAIGEVIQVVRQFDRPSKSTDPFENYAVPSSSSSSSTTPYSAWVPATAPDQTVASTGTALVSDVAEIERRAVALYKLKSYSDSRPLFDQACNGGEMKACGYLGYLYAQGLGGPRDTVKARAVYQNACDQGTLSSCASLGSLYQDAGDSDNARKYFEKACNGGIAEGCDLLRGVE